MTTSTMTSSEHRAAGRERPWIVRRRWWCSPAHREWKGLDVLLDALRSSAATSPRRTRRAGQRWQTRRATRRRSSGGGPNRSGAMARTARRCGRDHRDAMSGAPSTNPEPFDSSSLRRGMWSAGRQRTRAARPKWRWPRATGPRGATQDPAARADAMSTVLRSPLSTSGPHCPSGAVEGGSVRLGSLYDDVTAAEVGLPGMTRWGRGSTREPGFGNSPPTDQWP